MPVPLKKKQFSALTQHLTFLGRVLKVCSSSLDVICFTLLWPPVLVCRLGPGEVSGEAFLWGNACVISAVAG